MIAGEETWEARRTGDAEEPGGFRRGIWTARALLTGRYWPTAVISSMPDFDRSAAMSWQRLRLFSRKQPVLAASSLWD